MIKNIFSSKKMITGFSALFLALTASTGFAATSVYDTTLAGANSVPPVHSTATGSFTAWIDETTNTIKYVMKYSKLQGTPVATHIHFAQKIANGPPIVTICNNGDNKIQNCPPSGGKLPGVIKASDILAIPAQGLHAGDIKAAILFIKEGLTYVNVHTKPHHNGNDPALRISELRGQLEVNDHPIIEKAIEKATQVVAKVKKKKFR